MFRPAFAAARRATLAYTPIRTAARAVRASHGHAESPEPAGYAVGRLGGHKGVGYAKFIFFYTTVFLVAVTYKVYNTSNDSEVARAEALEYMKKNGEKFEYFLPETQLVKSKDTIV